MLAGADLRAGLYPLESPVHVGLLVEVPEGLGRGLRGSPLVVGEGRSIPAAYAFDQEGCEALEARLAPVPVDLPVMSRG